MATVEVLTETTLHLDTVETTHAPFRHAFLPILTGAGFAPAAAETATASTTTTSAPTPAVTPTTASNSAATFSALPTELHHLIFTSLDAIDSTCLGLTSHHFYSTYRQLYPSRIPLNQRRQGPNKLESAWEVLGPTTACRFCGIYRCELHMHIREFLPAMYEYCTVRQVFGLKAKEGADEHCYRCCPPMPKRCGRHWLPRQEEVEEVSKL
jgi:hypothetical protein